MQTKHAAVPCKATDLFKIGEAPEGFVEKLDAYLSTFAKPIKDDGGKMVCLNCGEPLDGFMHALGVGVAAVWDIAHGEAHCSGCHWPMRGMHYPKDDDGTELVSIRNFFLAYMPEHVERKVEAA